MQLIADQQFLDQIHEIRDKIFRITKRILVSQEEAEDATQEVIVKLWSLGTEKRKSFKSMEAYSVTTILEIPEGTVRVYLSRIRKKLKTQFLEIQNHGL